MMRQVKSWKHSVSYLTLLHTLKCAINRGFFPSNLLGEVKTEVTRMHTEFGAQSTFPF